MRAYLLVAASAPHKLELVAHLVRVRVRVRVRDRVRGRVRVRVRVRASRPPRPDAPRGPPGEA